METIENIVAPILEQEAAELVDLQYVRESGRQVLRFFLDKPGGITLADCERLSERIGSVLDVQDPIPESYVLEVASPGLDRVLKKEKDFLRFQGYRANLKLKEPLEGRRNFRGVLKGLESGQILLESEGKVFRLDINSLQEARLEPEINF